MPENCTDGRLVLIMSNHGAGENGEEYRRRNHYVYTDNELSLQFKPGRESCEPFRKYNTQPNGIYGWTPMSDREWQSFSNWCPGDVIDNRLIELGAVESGEHKVRIEVPEAEFYGKDGYFPVSIYFQGVTEGKLPQTSYIADVCEDDYTSNVIVTSEGIIVTAPEEIKEASVYTTDGKAVRHGKISGGSAVIETVGIEGGIYIVAVGTASRNEAHKICLR